MSNIFEKFTFTFNLYIFNFLPPVLLSEIAWEFLSSSPSLKILLYDKAIDLLVFFVKFT